MVSSPSDLSPASQLEGQAQTEAKTSEDTYALDSESSMEKLAALGASLARMVVPVEEEAEMDEFPADGEMTVQEEDRRKELEAQEKQKKLFEGLKFFLNREVPREALAFVIRSFGGDVSWDKSLCIGATYDVTDPCVTHQIVDRPGQQTPVIGRYVPKDLIFACVGFWGQRFVSSSRCHGGSGCFHDSSLPPGTMCSPSGCLTV